MINYSEPTPGVVRFSVKVIPRASASRIEGEQQGALRVRLMAPPVDGAANDELLALISEALGVRPRVVAIVSGATSRTKVVEVAGASVSRILALAGPVQA